MKDNKISIDLDLEDLFNLNETNKNTLAYDLNFILDNGIEKYIENQKRHEEEKRNFIELFKECFDELCEYMEQDPKRRVSVNCFSCVKGMDLRDKYGKPKKR